MMICGIDPGLSGGIAFLGVHCTVHDMPTLALTRGGKNKREIDAHVLADLLHSIMPDHCYVEQVGAMPGQGTSSMFAFGKAYGIVIGVLAALDIPTTFVNSRVWKKSLSVPAAKDGARARASQLMPSAAHQWTRVKDNGRAEAALIAHWGELR
jgi:crossover junction endodeoxyribonuclease RuvC